MLSPDQIARTEQRYGARDETHHGTDAFLTTEAVVHANGEGAVQRRLEHLGAEPAVARRVVNEIVATPEDDLPPDFRIIASEDEPDAVPATNDTDLSSAFFERILGTNELMESRFLQEGAIVSRAVGRVTLRDAGGSVGGYGTGVLIAPTLAMTNNHVLPSPASAQYSTIELDYETIEGGNLKTPVAFGLDPAAFFVTDVHLDYTIVAVAKESSNGTDRKSYGWVRLNPTLGKVITGERVNIIQHPNGSPKRVALRENRISDMLDDFLHYRTDTAPGSSGSPVFNDEWEIVALHHSGVPRRDTQDRILAIGGGIWNESMGETRIDWVANEGARISRIVAHLQSQRLDPEQHALLTSAIVGDATADEDSARPAPVEPLIQAVSPPGGQVTTVTIPLEISVRVGSVRAQGIDVTVGIPEVPDTAGPPTSDAEQLRDRATSAILAARERPYYDVEADETARADWYASIDLDGPIPGWTRELRALVTERHTRRFRYSTKLRNEVLYSWVDLREDLSVHSIYSGNAFPPEHFVEEDLRVEWLRASRTQELMARESMSSNPEQVRIGLQALERSLPYNCEHAVCQSWFGEAEPMRGDLHHLFACESRCNSFRKDTPYVEFSDFNEVVRDSCGKAEAIASTVEGNRRGFEPFAGKGTVARATLYFMLRYPDQISVYTRDDVTALLQWHDAEPVSLYERHRNAAIAEIQGNRNPFIDFPAWAERMVPC